MKPKGGQDDNVEFLQALGDPTRLVIARQLAATGEVCACDLTDCCGVSQPTVSHHLRVLREAGIVRSERRGTWIYYSLEPGVPARLTALAQALDPSRALPVASTDSRAAGKPRQPLAG